MMGFVLLTPVLTLRMFVHEAAPAPAKPATAKAESSSSEDSSDSEDETDAKTPAKVGM